MTMIMFCCRTLLVAKQQQPLKFRGLRGVARPRGQINETYEEPVQKPVIEEAAPKKSYRTYRQKIKQLKSKFSCQLVTADNQNEMVRNAVTMLHNLPYHEQVDMKQAKHEEIIERLSKQKNIRSQMARQKTAADIIGSSVTEQYRNKSTMSLGHDIQGNLTVGYHVGGRREGVVTVSPDAVSIIKESHKTVSRLYQEFLTSLSKDKVAMFKGADQGWSHGHWSELMVRSNYKDEFMVRVEYFTNNKENMDYESEVQDLLHKLLSTDLNIKSVFITEVSLEGTRVNKLIHGEPFLMENIGDLLMTLGPDSFCQVNPGVAVAMMDNVKKSLVTGDKRTLLDLCCGAGMFSLSMSPLFRGVIGIDSVDTGFAVNNCDLNNVNNCRFETKKVQNVLPSLAASLSEQGAAVSAILNPGRSGVHHNVITALRRLPILDNLVYISCQPEDTRVHHNLTMTEGGGMFVQVSPETIVAAGDSIGVANIPGNVTRALAEDVSYRTREVASLAALFLRHGRKRKLSVEDMNRALKWSDVGQVLGQGHGEETVSVGNMFHHIPQPSDIADIYIEGDREVDLVSASVTEDKPVLEQEQKLTINASWLHVEGAGEVGAGLSGSMLQYYNAVIAATMSDSELVCSTMMKDVATNPKISPILTYLITFIRQVMKRVSSRMKLQSRMLRLVSAIFSNPHLNLTPKPYLSHLVTAVLEKVCKDLVSVDHVIMASSILALALSRWATPVNQLRCQTVKHLRDVVISPVDKGLAQYGAVTCLKMLGPELLHPWPHQIWSHLDTCVTGAPPTNVSCLQLSALREAGAALLNHWHTASDNNTPSWQLYGQLYEYFHDSLVPLVKQMWRSRVQSRRATEPLGRMRISKVRVLKRSKTRDGDGSLTASQHFDFFADIDMGVPSDIFDEPVSSLDLMESQAAELRRPQYASQSSRSYTLSRSVKELFPESSVVRRRGFIVQLPGMLPSSSTPSSRLKKSLLDKSICIPWRHFVTGGRAGARYRKLRGIDRSRSYIDILGTSQL